MIRVVFVGGSPRAVPTLESFLHNGVVDVVYAVFSEGLPSEHQAARSLEAMALEHGLECVTETRISAATIKAVHAAQPDVIIGGGVWRSMIPREFFEIPSYGYISLHGTALPDYRGMAGIAWQIINGEPAVRMRMFQLSDGIDDGPLVTRSDGSILEYSIDIDNEKHLAEILDEYDRIHVESYRELFDLMQAGELRFLPQDEAVATFSCHRGPADAEIDWTRGTTDAFNLIRSQSRPYSGAFTHIGGQRVVIWRARPRPEYSRYIGRIPGKVVSVDREAGSAVILTGDSGIEVVEAETPGSMSVTEIFSSTRQRCQTAVEAAIARILDGQ